MLPERAFSEEWLFIPNPASGYTASDRKRCLTAQPILVNGEPERLPSYLKVPQGGSRDVDAKPPFLSYGWRLEGNKLMNIIRAKFPECVEVVAASKVQLTEFIDYECEEQEVSLCISDSMQSGESVMMSVYSLDTKDAIVQRLGIGPEAASQLNFGILCDSRGVPGFGLEMGTNYSGLLERDVQERLCELFELDASAAQWYLNRDVWYWRDKEYRRLEISSGKGKAPYELTTPSAAQ